MDADPLNPLPPRSPYEPPQVTVIDVIPEFAIDYPPPPPARRVWLPVALFVVTCVSTFVAGVIYSDHLAYGWWLVVLNGQLPDGWGLAVREGLIYSGAVMVILLCHEMGHFLQAVRYGIYASLPYFIPMPLTPIGTFGAVIGMEPRRGDRKAVFDIGISGPLAGLVPTIIFLGLGLHWSHWDWVSPAEQGERLVKGEPLLMQYFIQLLVGPAPHGYILGWHPLAFAGWVGLLITSINLIPIGQLDGGHILYAHVPQEGPRSLRSSVGAGNLGNDRPQADAVVADARPDNHARNPSSAHSRRLGPVRRGRYVLGILTLAFLFFGFTPVPMSVLGH